MMCSPQAGSFVVFSLDPTSMVEGFCNPALTKACQNLKMGKYVAYISQLDQVASPFPSGYVSVALHFVFQGASLTTFDWIEGIQQDMVIPVLPNTRHPSRRAPLDPGAPFPWKKCNISPLVVTWAKVSLAYTDCQVDSQPIHMTTPEDHRRVRSLMDADVNMWNAMGRGKRKRGAHRPLQRSPRRRLRQPEVLKEGEHNYECNENTSEDNESFHTAKTSQSDHASGLLKYVCSSTQRFSRKVDALRTHAVSIEIQKAAMEPIIKISSDLNTVQKLCPPQQYFQERDVLQRLIRQYEIPMKAEKHNSPKHPPEIRKGISQGIGGKPWFNRIISAWSVFHRARKLTVIN